MALALGMGAFGTLGSATAAQGAPNADPAGLGYAGPGQDPDFLGAIVHAAHAKQAAEPGLQTVTITYNDSDAPSFQDEIARSTAIWNSSVNHVTLRETTGAGDFDYRQGYGGGSHATRSYVYLDIQQAHVYAPTRIIAHETGHILGLSDDYDGPCSELMSGHGPGPECTNAYPDAAESARVDELWG